MNALRERFAAFARPNSSPPTEDFHFVNFTVGLFAVNCFLLVASKMIPVGGNHAEFIAAWFGSGSTVLLAGVAILAFVHDCGWKAWFLGPVRGLTRFVVLSSVLVGIVLLQVVLSQTLI